MVTNGLVDRVKQHIAYVQKIATVPPGKPELKVLDMVEFAPGVICVHDTWNEYDSYFDRPKWDVKDKQLWGDHLYLRDNQTLGVLPGLGAAPRVRNFEEAFDLAKTQITSNSEKWYDTPQPVRF